MGTEGISTPGRQWSYRELIRLLEGCRVMNEGRDEVMLARIHPTLPADLDEA